MVRILDFLIVAGPAILVARLFASGLYRRYRAFFAYLIFATLRSGVLAITNPTGGIYFHIWVVTEPVEWLFYVFAVLEIYSLVLQDYRGLATVGRWALIAAFAIAVLASGVGVLVPSHYTTQGRLMTYLYVTDRAVYFSLAVFLLTILGVLMQYPIHLNRNILLHSVVFSVYFLANTVSYLLLSMGGAAVLDEGRIIISLITVAAIGVWLGMLNPAGELRQQSLRPTWMPGREEELTIQLRHLNEALLRHTKIVAK